MTNCIKTGANLTDQLIAEKAKVANLTQLIIQLQKDCKNSSAVNNQTLDKTCIDQLKNKTKELEEALLKINVITTTLTKEIIKGIGLEEDLKKANETIKKLLEQIDAQKLLIQQLVANFTRNGTTELKNCLDLNINLTNQKINLTIIIELLIKEKRDLTEKCQTAPNNGTNGLADLLKCLYDLSVLKTELEKAQQNIYQLKQQLWQLTVQNKDLEKELQRVRDESYSFQTQVSQLLIDILKLKEKLRKCLDLNPDLTGGRNYEAEIAALNVKISILQAENERLRKDCGSGGGDNDEKYKKCLDDLAAKQNELNVQILIAQNLQKKVTELTSRISDLEAELKNKNNLIDQQQQKLTDLQKQINQLTTVNQQLTINIQQLQNQGNLNQQLQNEINKYQDKQRQLNDIANQMQQLIDRQQSILRYIMDKSNENTNEIDSLCKMLLNALGNLFGINSARLKQQLEKFMNDLRNKHGELQDISNQLNNLKSRLQQLN